MVVATWNLENLLRPPSEAGPTGQEAYEAKLGELARLIGEIAPDVLAVQEIGGPEPLGDLRQRLEGDWHAASSELPDARGIRVGFLSRLALEDITDVGDFPEGLRPVQVDDDGSTIAAMGRGALRVRVRVRVRAEGRDVDVVNCHLKSKLLTFPHGFSPQDEGQRARYGAYALYRRAAEAVTVRAYANELLQGQGRERAVIVLGDLNDVPEAATTQILLGPPGSEIATPGFERPQPGRRMAAVEPRTPDPRGATLHASLSRPRGAHRPHPRQQSPGPDRAGRRHARRATPVDHRGPTERRDQPASDHLPVVARFVLE